MLDLEPRVHLEEVELAAHVDEELHGARVHVAGRAGHPTRRLTEALAQRRVHEGRRRFLDELLVATLDRALALAEVDHVTVAIGEHLNLDVAGGPPRPPAGDPRPARGARAAPRRPPAPGPP